MATQSVRVKAPQVNHGKAFEKELNEAMLKLPLEYPCRWERVIDSHTAGNYIRVAESDFRLAVQSEHPGRPWLYVIECKASVIDTTFKTNFRSLCKGPQVGQMRLALRTGAIGLYFFKDMQGDKIEIWNAKTILEAYPQKRKPLIAEPLTVIAAANLGFFCRTWMKNPDAINAYYFGGIK